MSISDETLRLTERLRKDLNGMTDAQARDMVAGWARAWDEVAGDLDDALQALALQAGDGALTRTMLRRSARLAASLRVISRELRTLADDAGVRIVGDLDAVVELAGTSQATIIASQLPKAHRGLVIGWDRVDEHVIRAIVKRSTQQIHSLTKPLSAEAERAMKRELLRGLSVGANPRETARRMVRRVEGRFNGGLTRALTISRTESLDALRAGARASQDANSAVLQGWIWSAQLNADTCPACWGMHGSVHKLSEPGPLGHQNCRCARTPKTLSWRDLGIDLDEPADVMPDAGQAFKQLAKSEQLAVLGPGRYAAWSRGDLPMEDWAVKRTTAGWRDSFVPVKVPA